MARFLYRNLSDFLRKWGIVILAFSWLSGLWLGVMQVSDSGQTITSLMPVAIHSRLSIVGLLISVFLPFLFSAFAVYISQPVLLIFICFVKAVSVSFVSSCLSLSVGGGAWIFRLLVLFHDFSSCAMLLIFSMWHISTGKSLSRREVLLYILFGTLAAAVQFYIMEPFLAELILF